MEAFTLVGWKERHWNLEFTVQGVIRIAACVKAGHVCLVLTQIRKRGFSWTDEVSVDLCRWGTCVQLQEKRKKNILFLLASCS